MRNSTLVVFVAALAATGSPRLASSQDTAAGSAGAAIGAAPTAASLTLLPVPSHVALTPGRLPLDRMFLVAVSRYSDPRLTRAIDRVIGRLERRMVVPLARSVVRDTVHATLVVTVRGAGQAVQSVTEDESYTLEITPQHASLRANTVVGALRGLETFLQLIGRDASGFSLPAGTIDDGPRFPWRGLLIDVARHFEPVDVIERNIDAMAAVKMNVLHLHLADDQAWRVESKRFPPLHQVGSDGSYYAQAAIREIVRYARDRGVRVVPEFDVPGHTTSMLVAYPKYGSRKGSYVLAQDFHVTDAALDPTRDAVYHFLDGVIGEMSSLFPDAYFHVGGDEVNGELWLDNPTIHRFMRRHKLADAPALQAYFNRRLSRVVHAHGKRMIGWDEILHADLPTTVVVQSWRGAASLAQGAEQGYFGLLSAGYYLDAMLPASAHYTVDPLPAGLGLDSAQAARVLGGEACMWGELVTPETIDSRIWPRAAAIAERLWSPREVTDVADMYRRLASVSVELEELQLRSISAAPPMLRRLVGSEEISPLEALLRVAEPITLSQRQRSRRATTLTPLVAPGDIARPDAPGARAMEPLVSTVLHNSANAAAARDSLTRTFAEWRRIAANVHAIAQQVPTAIDADSAASALVDVAGVGEAALGYIVRRQAAPADWLPHALAVLDRAAAPRGMLRLAIVPPVRALALGTGAGNSATGAQR